MSQKTRSCQLLCLFRGGPASNKRQKSYQWVAQLAIYNHDDIYVNDVPKIETISRILQQKFKLFKETYDDNQVHSPLQACAASPSIDIYIPNVNVDINDELD